MKDGGAAFPCPMGPDFPECDRGMSLRAWLAGQALSGFCANSTDQAFQAPPMTVAVWCREVADAVIAEMEANPCPA